MTDADVFTDADPIESACWDVVLRSDHARCKAWRWDPQTFLVRCGEHPVVLGAVDGDNPNRLCPGDPDALDGSLRLAADAITHLARHAAPYEDDRLTEGVVLLARLVGAVRDRSKELTA